MYNYHHHKQQQLKPQLFMFMFSQFPEEILEQGFLQAS